MYILSAFQWPSRPQRLWAQARFQSALTSRTPFAFNNWHKWFFYLYKILWGICKQITLLMLYEVTSRLATLLKFTDSPILVVNFIVLIVLFKLINFTFCSKSLESPLTLFNLSVSSWCRLQPLQFILLPLIYKF
jgi:hypothetical protein